MKKIIGTLPAVRGGSALRPAVFLFCLSLHVAQFGIVPATANCELRFSVRGDG
jgi:hypothetical protein